MGILASNSEGPGRDSGDAQIYAPAIRHGEALGTQPDELCAPCSNVDFFSLFTGPRYDEREERVSIKLHTAAEIIANTRCPSCRLLRHELYQGSGGYPWKVDGKDVSPSKVQCIIQPFRSDYEEAMKYYNKKTKQLLATHLIIRWLPLEGLSEQEKHVLSYSFSPGSGIKLLSPDDVDPNRPLLNGYQATTVEKSLDLLQQWMDTCISSHIHQSSRPIRRTEPLEHDLRLIDVKERVFVDMAPGSIDYAALSYVWGDSLIQYITIQEQLEVKMGTAGKEAPALPSKIPRVIEDAIYVCSKISIPFLWVDLYCINQGDPGRKASEIKSMGRIYSNAKITLIAGCSGDAEAGLLPTEDFSRIQKVETIQGRKYITSLPSVVSQIQGSKWNKRAWTMQEGQLATRCAFFGKYDISFLCESGQWQESQHSGPYGHDSEITDIDISAGGYHVLSALSWTRDRVWDFRHYNSLLMNYSSRQLSYEKDKLNAVTGCLNILTSEKGVEFVSGLPVRDIHYALLWTGEYDRAREGFPSWSWAGWHCLMQMYMVYPVGAADMELHTTVQLQGYLISPLKQPRRLNQCSQKFASISVSEDGNSISIESESAHFAIDITSTAKPTGLPLPTPIVHHDYDSTVSINQTWDSDVEYRTPYARMHLRDCHGNTHAHHYPRWFDRWPPLKLCLPRTLRGSTLTWLLRDGIELVRILEIELLEVENELEPFQLVLCLGVDRTENKTRRLGMFCIPKEIWVTASPKSITVTLE